MKYREVGLRALYKQFVVYMLNDRLKEIISGYPNVQKGNCVLTYGYIDRQCGLTMEVIAIGNKSKDNFTFFDASPEYRVLLRIGSIIDEEFDVLNNADNCLSERYHEKIECLDIYSASDAVERTRTFAFLDKSRHEIFPDDVQVYFKKRGLGTEVCWVHIIGLADSGIKGILLNEPNQDFGCHNGDIIEFYVQKTADNRVICSVDMTPELKLTAEALKDGKMLKEAISAFHKERTEDNLLDVLMILRESYVWVPCNAVMSETDASALNKLAENAGGDLNSLIGKTFTNQENVRLIPDILQKGEEYFFPVFSSDYEMGEYGKSFSKIQMHMLEVIPLARNNEKKVAGIAVNAFSEAFVIDKALFAVLEKMESCLE